MTRVAGVLSALLHCARIISARRHLPLDGGGVEIVRGNRRIRRFHERTLHAVTRIHAHFGYFDARRIWWANHSAGAARRNYAPTGCAAGRDDRTTGRNLRTARSD